MLRRIVSLLAVGLASLGIVVGASAPASAATTTRMMSIWGSVHIEDYETFSSNQHCYSSINTNATANSAYPIQLEWIRRCGGEIRAELHMQAQVLPNNHLSVIGEVLFFEGTSTNTSDLDGTKNFTLYVPPGTSSPLNLHAWNEEEEDCDCVDYRLRVGNYTP